jgi:hypothetical protein
MLPAYEPPTAASVTAVTVPADMKIGTFLACEMRSGPMAAF